MYETEYRLEYILRKINFEKLRVSNDQGVMFCKFIIQQRSSDISVNKSSFHIVVDLYTEDCIIPCATSVSVLCMLVMLLVMLFIVAAARLGHVQTNPNLTSFHQLLPVSLNAFVCLTVIHHSERVTPRHPL